MMAPGIGIMGPIGPGTAGIRALCPLRPLCRMQLRASAGRKYDRPSILWLDHYPRLCSWSNPPVATAKGRTNLCSTSRRQRPTLNSNQDNYWQPLGQFAVREDSSRPSMYVCRLFRRDELCSQPLGSLPHWQPLARIPTATLGAQELMDGKTSRAFQKICCLASPKHRTSAPCCWIESSPLPACLLVPRGNAIAQNFLF